MSSPDTFLLRLINRLLHPSLRDEIMGDLEEDYHQNSKTHGPRRARLRLMLATLGYVRYFNLFKTTMNHRSTTGVWKNYFLISYRNLLFNKRNTLISVLGLVIGLAAAIAILQYTWYEQHYDSFYEKPIYRLTHSFTNSSGNYQSATTFFAVKDAILQQVPEVESATNYLNANALVKIEDQIFEEESVVFTGPEFFEVFGFKLRSGSASALAEPNSVLISHSTAQRYFGDQSAIDQSINLQGIFGQNYRAVVAGVFEDIPHYSHLRANMLLPDAKMESIMRQDNFFGGLSFDEVPWRWLSKPTYVTLKPGVDRDKTVASINQIIAENRAEVNTLLNQEHSIWMQPIQDIHVTPGIQAELTPSNNKEVLSLFNIIAAVILIIAWINYINLATARAVTRGKEVGVRKVLGSSKFQLKSQFLIEAFLVNLIALSLSVLILFIARNQLHQLVGVDFLQNQWTNIELIAVVALIWTVGSFLSGFYPAFLMSNYRIIEVLKGKLKYSNKGVVLRRLLVVCQFVASIFLISALFIIQKQMDFMINHNLGINIEQTIVLDGPVNIVNNDAQTANVRSFIQELNGIGGVNEASVSTMVPGIENFWRSSMENRNEEGAGAFIHRSLIDDQYLDLFNFQLLAGRKLDKTRGNEGLNMVINETARRVLGYDSPNEVLGKKLYLAGEEFKVVGVVDDFYQRGPHLPFEPMSFQLDTALVGQFYVVKVNQDNMREILPQIESKFQLFFPDSPYEARLLDDIFAQQYEAEFRFRNLFTIFASIAVIVAALGLIGLSAYLVNQKNKEISIRKVLGAGKGHLFLILNKEYLILTGVSFLLTIPLITLLSPYWLNNFANRVNLELVFFLIPLALILLVIFVTTAGFTYKVLTVNPAKTLHDE